MTGVSGDGPTREQEIRQRLEAATPGPWENNGGWAIEGPFTPTGRLALGVVVRNNRANALQDAKLIAHAPADLAYLLGEVAQLREQLKSSSNPK